MTELKYNFWEMWRMRLIASLGWLGVTNGVSIIFYTFLFNIDDGRYGIEDVPYIALDALVILCLTLLFTLTIATLSAALNYRWYKRISKGQPTNVSISETGYETKMGKIESKVPWEFFKRRHELFGYYILRANARHVVMLKESILTEAERKAIEEHVMPSWLALFL